MFNPGDVVKYHDQEWEVTVAPEKTALCFKGEDLVWALRLPERTILRYFKFDEISARV